MGTVMSRRYVTEARRRGRLFQKVETESGGGLLWRCALWDSGRVGEMPEGAWEDSLSCDVAGVGKDVSYLRARPQTIPGKPSTTLSTRAIITSGILTTGLEMMLNLRPPGTKCSTPHSDKTTPTTAKPSARCSIQPIRSPWSSG
ncbi:hypothetical protein BJ508DRAFT_27480 [Ascobolus immersus RN42]|uniref:Uncharacterized protein n=1 Tax=Ascobolus immersus RN42 TaxID=1160509 RepID=A0A3N4IFB1_ASCIM|nr:hypothetical protein BJ508DRAFT_27480 [Ascobolus immersus RN42]